MLFADQRNAFTQLVNLFTVHLPMSVVGCGDRTHRSVTGFHARQLRSAPNSRRGTGMTETIHATCNHVNTNRVTRRRTETPQTSRGFSDGRGFVYLRAVLRDGSAGLPSVLVKVLGMRSSATGSLYASATAAMRRM